MHAVLNGDAAARAKPRLREVIAEHDEWLRGKRFLMVPYHLVGAANPDEALLDGYVRTVRELHPGAPTPTVFRSDAMLADARRMREQLGDDAFVRLLPDDGGVRNCAINHGPPAPGTKPPWGRRRNTPVPGAPRGTGHR